ncbi:potassium channel family protein [Streptomyces sp. NPDC059455]|uniref:potassium channel family protein n=1 Tax=Streptomyces sp. NPDC059455 TaxID=3346837 RepID=UPI003693A8E7
MAGAATVMFILRDVFHTLWHPTRHGGLSRMVMTGLWRLSSRLSPRRRAAGLAGPLGMVVVVAMWACGVAIGWALVYWPHMPYGFSFARGLDPMEHSTPVDALYISLVTLATLGLGDITPTVGWLRIVAPLEALVGFALLTATVSWVLGIYPALTRRRALALRLSHLRRAHLTEESLDTASAVALLDGLAADVARVHVDFLQYAESYCFHDGLGDTSLAHTISYAAELGQSIRATGHADVRASAAVLTVALEDLAAVLDQRFLHTGGSVYEIFRAYARDHNGLGPA